MQSRDDRATCPEKCSAKGYSITSLARTRRTVGTVRPSAFAVLRLISNSYLAGDCTGVLEVSEPETTATGRGRLGRTRQDGDLAVKYGSRRGSLPNSRFALGFGLGCRGLG
jgi:hypothetical protein